MADSDYQQSGGDQDHSQQGDGFQGGSTMHLEVHTGKPHRVQVKVNIPVKEHPNFNFVGKLLGPKGSSLKQLQEMTQTRMAILGRGSMRDKKKEEELRSKGEPKYMHLNEELHVEITAYAAPAEAYRRIAAALEEIARFLVPDYAADGRPYQFNEMAAVNGGRGRGKPPVYGYDDPTIAPGPPPPPGPAPPARNPAYWASSPPVRGAAPRRVLQPGPAAGAPRRVPPVGGADYSYEDPYSSYDSAAGRSSEYYSDQVLDEGDVNFAADDYGAEPPRSAVGPTRTGYPRPRTHPYAAASARPY